MRVLPWLLVACSDPAGDGPSTPSEPPPDPPPDQAELEVVELEWTDDARVTPALGGEPETPGRVLHTWVWIGPSPGEDAPSRPLLLVAHGIDGHPTKFDAFARTMANAGFVVAAPAFPISNADRGLGLASIADFAEQPEDLRFVLDRLLEEVDDEASPLWHRFDPERVAALGHSMGGGTLLGLSRFGGGDPRIDAEIYVSAAVALTVIYEEPMDVSGPPTLLFHGVDDITVPPSSSDELYEDLEDPRWYVKLQDCGHSDPVESLEDPPSPARAATQDAVTALLHQTFFGEAGALDPVLADLAADGHTVLPAP